MSEFGISLNDDAAYFISCPGKSPCCSFTATESYIFFGHSNGEITVCTFNNNSFTSLKVILEEINLFDSYFIHNKDLVDDDNTIFPMIDCISACPYVSSSEILLSILHRRCILTFITFNLENLTISKDSFHIGNSVKLNTINNTMQYTNRSTSHCWLDDDTFLVGCLDGVVLAISASVNSSRIVLKEESPIIQISWDNKSKILIVSSLKRSIVTSLTNDILNIKTIGSKAREEGVFGACISSLNSIIYAVRHNSRIFEFNSLTGVVSRTYRLNAETPLGILKPLVLDSSINIMNLNQSNDNINDKNMHNSLLLSSSVLLWSEGPRFISILKLSETETSYITRKFDNFAIVSTVLLSKYAIVLCSDNRLMIFPFMINFISKKENSNSISIHNDNVLDENESKNEEKKEQLLQQLFLEPSVTTSNECESIPNIEIAPPRRKKIVKKKIVRVVIRKKKKKTVITDNNNNNNNTPILASFSNSEKVCEDTFVSSPSSSSILCDIVEKYPIEREVISIVEGTINTGIEYYKDEKIKKQNSLHDDFYKISTTENNNSLHNNTNNMNKKNEKVEETLKNNYRRFRIEVDHLIRLYNVNALHIDAHSQIYNAVQEFLPLLEEQLLENGYLLWPFKVIPFLSEVGSCCNHLISSTNIGEGLISGNISSNTKIKDDNFFLEDEVKISALRNVLKSSIAWSLKDVSSKEENNWMQTLFVLHLLLAIPWPISSSSSSSSSSSAIERNISRYNLEEMDSLRIRLLEERWLEEANIIEKTVERCGSDENYLSLVLALSNYIFSFSSQITRSHNSTPMRLSVLLNGHEKTAIFLAHLQTARKSSMHYYRLPLSIEFNLEDIIIQQSSHIIDALEEAPYPFCTFFAFFPYIFAIFPSKAILLALQHYPGVSFAYFEWALSTPVQGIAFQILCDLGTNIIRLSFEDLADGLADLVLALYEASVLDICKISKDYEASLRILLQRRFTLLRWTLQLEEERLRYKMENNNNNNNNNNKGNFITSAPIARRKLQRLEGAILGLLQRVQVVINTLANEGKEKQEKFKQNILELLEEHEFPEGVLTVDWKQEFMLHCIHKNCIEKLLPLFQIPNGTSDLDWAFLFQQSYEVGMLEIAMLFCFTVEKLPGRVLELLESVFPLKLNSFEAAGGDAQLERVGMKLRMLY